MAVTKLWGICTNLNRTINYTEDHKKKLSDLKKLGYAKQEAHSIGIELANEMCGDRYEVIVTTHFNTKYLHNHFIINSVSFIDGKKFNVINFRQIWKY